MLKKFLIISLSLGLLAIALPQNAEAGFGFKKSYGVHHGKFGYSKHRFGGKFGHRKFGYNKFGYNKSYYNPHHRGYSYKRSYYGHGYPKYSYNPKYHAPAKKPFQKGDVVKGSQLDFIDNPKIKSIKKANIASTPSKTRVLVDKETGEEFILEFE